MSDEYKNTKNKRKKRFEFLKKTMRLLIKESKFVCLGEKIDKNAIIMSNHVGTSAPLTRELYGDSGFRFWGASEMNSGLGSLYKYQTRVFYHEKNIGIYIVQGFSVVLLHPPLHICFTSV